MAETRDGTLSRATLALHLGPRERRPLGAPRPSCASVPVRDEADTATTPQPEPAAHRDDKRNRNQQPRADARELRRRRARGWYSVQSTSTTFRTSNRPQESAKPRNFGSPRKIYGADDAQLSQTKSKN